MTEPAPHSGALRLADWGVVRAAGPDARSFLHSQLTQDMTSLQPGRARLAGYCSPKGRLLATFVAWTTQADGDVLLACSADVLPQALKRLSMFVLRAKCKLSDASGEFALWGLAGPIVLDVAAAASWQVSPWREGVLVTLPPALVDGAPVPRALWAAPAEAAAPDVPALAPAAWAALEACSGVLRVVAATSEQFVPQMANLELVGGVNFQKGCYPGQEIVARSQYRGTLKRRGYVLTAGAALAPGQDVFHSDDPAQPAGTVALAGTLDDGRHVALASLKIAATSAGTLSAGTPDGPPLHVAALPYEIPLEAA